jgi:hypothetical protein
MRSYPVVVCFRLTDEQKGILADFLTTYAAKGVTRAQRFREALEGWSKDQIPACMSSEE